MKEQKFRIARLLRMAERRPCPNFSLRTANRTVTLHDASYLRPLELRGPPAALHAARDAARCRDT